MPYASGDDCHRMSIVAIPGLAHSICCSIGRPSPRKVWSYLSHDVLDQEILVVGTDH